VALAASSRPRELQAGPGTEVWRFATGEAVLASPAVARDGTIYVGSYDRNLYALRPDGTIKWTFPLPPPIYIYFATYTGIFGSPALGADGTVYLAAENGRLHAINPTNGLQKWEYPTMYMENAIYSDPAVGPDGTIYFAFYEALSPAPTADHLVALNPNGTRKWGYRTPAPIFSDPTVGLDGTVYVGCDNGHLYALNPTGTKKWEFNTGSNAITASAAIGSNGMIYVGVGSASNPRFYCINTNGTTNWVFTVGSRVRSSPAIGPDGTIYFGCDDRRLYALNPDGTKRWDFSAGGAIGSSPAVAADGTVLFGADDGNVYALNAGGALQWTFATGDYVYASPAITPEGTIYVASADHHLFVLRGCDPPALGAWSMFRQNAAREGRQYPGVTNQPPVLASLTDHSICPGQTLLLTNSAIDPDDPAGALTFELAPGAPAGASVDVSNGIFSWTPTAGQAGTTNCFAVAVSDHGTPPLTDVECFTVTVQNAPFIQSIVWSDGSAKITWSAIAGRTYQVRFAPTVDATEWMPLPGTVTAPSDSACYTDSSGPEPQRFYRVQLFP
jgi:outer membrane protein assembly factor BamB